MANPLASKLERYGRLTSDESDALDVLLERRVRRIRAREHVIHEGDRPRHLNLIIEGWAYRYKILADGRRQIVALLIPGDLCDLHLYVLDEMDHSVAALTPLTYAQISRHEFEALLNDEPCIATALWRDALVMAAIQREWTVSVARSGLERVAHLMLELFYRLNSVGLTDGQGCEFPLKQTEMAEALGLTPVHTNRVIQRLRGERLVELNGKRLEIHDIAALERLALFNPNYLHLQRERQLLDAND